MTDKELLNQLNKLRQVVPSAEFKAANRQLLLSQIAQGQKVTSLGFAARLNIAFSRLLQPSAVAVMIVLFFAVSGVWGWNASQAAKPGDSLYLAKKLAERAKLLVTMDEKGKSLLNLEFAANRLQEMAALDSDDNRPVQETLKNDFKKEIGQVKDRLAKNNQAPASDRSQDFQSADQGKDNVKIDIAVPGRQTATSTEQKVGLGEVLEEAEKLFDSGAYDQAAYKLDEANKMIK